MSIDSARDTPPEFSIRADWRGKFILRVRTFETLGYSGEWIDARPRDLPTFFEYLQKGRPTKP